jgi:hypothetical protein
MSRSCRRPPEHSPGGCSSSAARDSRRLINLLNNHLPLANLRCKRPGQDPSMISGEHAKAQQCYRRSQGGRLRMSLEFNTSLKVLCHCAVSARRGESDSEPNSAIAPLSLSTKAKTCLRASSPNRLAALNSTISPSLKRIRMVGRTSSITFMYGVRWMSAASNGSHATHATGQIQPEIFGVFCSGGSGVTPSNLIELPFSHSTNI